MFAALQLLAAIAVLCLASARDLRTRRVSNTFWIGLSVLGIVLLPLRIINDDAPIEYSLILIPVFAILSDVFLDLDGDSTFSRYFPMLKYGVALAATTALGMVWIDEKYFQPLLAIPVVMMVIVLMYMFDLIRGGADAKALISLTVLFPAYPVVAGFPLIAANETLQIIFPFSLSVLVNAAILVVFLPIVFLAKNLARGDVRFPQAFAGYRMDIDRVAGKHVWLMERIENDQHIFYARPRSDEDLVQELGRLRERGLTRVWVTPKIPFIVPMLAGFVLTIIAGNVLFLLFSF